MKSEQFNNIITEQIQKCKDVLCFKATQYAENNDRLHNFKVAADIQCCEPKQALSGMMAKHTVSIYDMCRSNKIFSKELWDEKITDNINYLLLLQALIHEEFGWETNESDQMITNDYKFECISCDDWDCCPGYSSKHYSGCDGDTHPLTIKRN